MKTTVLVTGATGHVGRRVAEILLESGIAVRAVGRDGARLRPLVERGALACVGDQTDTAFLTAQLRGADAAFVMVPPDYAAADLRASYRRHGASLAQALTAAATPFAVTLSSVGAERSEGTGPILGLHDLEELLNGIAGLAAVHLRAAYFMENQLFNVGTIQNAGINGGTISGEVPIPMVATGDIAVVAATLLRDRRAASKSHRYVLGPRDLTLREATRSLGNAIGRPDLQYVEFPEDGARQAMLGMGLSPDVVERFLEMNRALSSGWITVVGGRTPESTTPTTFESFAREVLAPAFG
jgi:uncharacterized protein YbjT (DUF2867 family)